MGSIQRYVQASNQPVTKFIISRTMSHGHTIRPPQPAVGIG